MGTQIRAFSSISQFCEKFYLETCALRSHSETPFFLQNPTVPFVQHSPWVHKEKVTEQLQTEQKDKV